MWFIKKTGTPKTYNPDGDRKPGHYSEAFLCKYKLWLEAEFNYMRKIISKRREINERVIN